MSLQITQLRRSRDGRPRPWRVTLAGADREFDVGTRTLMSAAAFRRRALIALGRLPPAMTNQQWLRTLGAAMARVEVEE